MAAAGGGSFPSREEMGCTRLLGFVRIPITFLLKFHQHWYWSVLRIFFPTQSTTTLRVIILSVKQILAIHLYHVYCIFEFIIKQRKIMCINTYALVIQRLKLYISYFLFVTTDLKKEKYPPYFYAPWALKNVRNLQSRAKPGFLFTWKICPSPLSLRVSDFTNVGTPVVWHLPSLIRWVVPMQAESAFAQSSMCVLWSCALFSTKWKWVQVQCCCEYLISCLHNFFPPTLQDVGRMKIELFADVVPRTAENFRYVMILIWASFSCTFSGKKPFFSLMID